MTRFAIQAMAALAVTMLVSTAAMAQNEPVLGTKLPLADRSMPSSNGNSQRLADLAGPNGTVVLFWSNNCPWVDKYEDRLSETVSRFSQAGFGFVLVNSNDPVAFPEEAIDGIRERASSRNYTVPYLLDEGSQLAKALGAVRTPHVYVFDGSGGLVYSGAIDDSPGDPADVTETFLVSVLGSMSNGQKASVTRTTSFGCRIKAVQ
ncbi:MAG TPA: thioredoxin family protein [Rhodothermales bacterium]